ncbi:MAG: HAD-IIA family hydrolase [Chloroflexi bacterium]|nr:HAD-IIA family hydrolase [Chloroflexota bacterium]
MNKSLSDIKAAILDMDGVIWKSHQPLCDLNQLFEEFKRHQIKFLFATNNAMSTVEQYVKKFASMDAIVESWQILTSSIATGYILSKDFPAGGPIHVMGSQALESTLAEYKFTNTDKDPIAVVGGLDPLTSYERLRKASFFIQSGIPFYFTNPDATYPTPEGLCPGAGTFLAALETASGVKAKLAGKPLPYIFEAGLERLKIPAQQTLVIGDRLETDILGGYRAGCKTALVLTGVATRADLESWSPAPDIVVENVMDLFDLVE